MNVCISRSLHIYILIQMFQYYIVNISKLYLYLFSIYEGWSKIIRVLILKIYLQYISIRRFISFEVVSHLEKHTLSVVVSIDDSIIESHFGDNYKGAEWADYQTLGNVVFGSKRLHKPFSLIESLWCVKTSTPYILSLQLLMERCDNMITHCVFVTDFKIYLWQAASFCVL